MNDHVVRSVKCSTCLLMLAFGTLRSHGQEAGWRQDASSPRIQSLKQEVKAGHKDAVDQFWRERQARETPLVEPDPGRPGQVLVTFLYRETQPTAGVVLCIQLTTSRDENINLAHLSRTDIWYKTYELRDDFRLSYSFVVNPTAEKLSYANRSSWTEDPLNPKKTDDETGYSGRSTLELPHAMSQQAIQPTAGIAQGTLHEKTVQSNVLKEQRTAWIYVPPGYDPKQENSYPLLVCFDGWIYSGHGIPTPTILDNLIASRKIPPLIAVFVDQAPQPRRNIELGNNDSFVQFVADELLPQIRRDWPFSTNPADTVVCGSSAGGLGSAFFAFSRPDLFGNVLSQSGAFWPDKERGGTQHEWLTTQYANSAAKKIRFVLQVGIVEVVPTPGNGPSILASNRHLRDVLQAKGYDVNYTEVAGAHEPLTWRGGVETGLIFLLRKTPR